MRWLLKIAGVAAAYWLADLGWQWLERYCPPDEDRDR